MYVYLQYVDANVSIHCLIQPGWLPGRITLSISRSLRSLLTLYRLLADECVF